MPRKFYQHKPVDRAEDWIDFLRALNQDFAEGFTGNQANTTLDTIADTHPNRRIYSEQQLAYVRQIVSVGGQFKEADWIVYELGPHKITDPIPTFQGWTPHFAFNESGFDLARRLELIDIPKGQISLEEGERFLQYGYRHAGTPEVFEQKRPKIEATFNELNKKGIEFIVFRTYSNIATPWDTLYFYSRDFRDT